MNKYGQIKNFFWYIGFRKPIKDYVAKQDIFWIGFDILTRDKEKPVFRFAFNWYVFDGKNKISNTFRFI